MSDKFELVAAKLEALKAEMIAEINRSIFSVPVGHVPRTLTRRERLQIAVARVRGYFRVLWSALKGEDPYDDYHW